MLESNLKNKVHVHTRVWGLGWGGGGGLTDPLIILNNKLNPYFLTNNI